MTELIVQLFFLKQIEDGSTIATVHARWKAGRFRQAWEVWPRFQCIACSGNDYVGKEKNNNYISKILCRGAQLE